MGSVSIESSSQSDKVPQFSPNWCITQCSVCSSPTATVQCIQGPPWGLCACCLWGHEPGGMWPSGNLPSPQAANSSSQYAKKERFYSESSLEVDNWPLFKRIQLVYLDLSSSEDRIWCPEHMSKCSTTGPSFSIPFQVQQQKPAPQPGHYSLLPED
jgi:hypothetical protein